jgi:hypothetical protein
MLASCTHDIALVDRIDDVKTGRDLDILMVFDNSPDRSSYDQMASQLDTLETRLQLIDGQVPSLHIGVVTADLGTSGTQDATPVAAIGHCSGDGGKGVLTTFNTFIESGYIEDLRGPNGTRVRNYDAPNLASEVRLLTNPGTGAGTGCEFGQPLEAMRRALDPATNPGFIRPDAQLMVVFLTHIDDCSLARGAMLDPNDASLGPQGFRCTEQGVICDEEDPRKPGVHTNCRPREGSELMVDVSEYKTFLEQYKADPQDVIVSAVAGARTPFRVLDVPVLAPSCQSAAGFARPAVRIGALVDAFGGATVDGCSQDAAYTKLTAPILKRQKSCFQNLARADGEDCRVIEIVGAQQTEFARCADGGAMPCWSIDADTSACPGGENLAIAISRGNTTVPTDSRIAATCSLK